MNREWLQPAIYGIILVAFVAIWLFPRLEDLPTRGEETRWATVAREMARTGDWVVPRQQGEAFLSRPPMGSWLIALAGSLRGTVDLFAIRLPTALATLGISLLIFLFARRELSDFGALFAGLSFAFCFQVIQLSRVAETDIVFTAFVAAALFGWHWLWSMSLPRWMPWVLGYSLVALGALAKGSQAPIYFVGATWVYLILNGNWKSLFSVAHCLGGCAFIAVMAAWHIPFIQAVGIDGVWQIWSGDVKLRWVDSSITGWIGHLFTFPLELIAGLLPWSVCFLFLLDNRIRRELWFRSTTRFALIAIVIAFPTCWLVPNAKVRYFLPLFPQFALILGSLADSATRRHTAALMKKLAVTGNIGSTLLIVTAATVAITTSAGFKLGPYAAVPAQSAIVAVALLLALAITMFLVRIQSTRSQMLLLAVLVAASLGSIDALVRIPMAISRDVDTAQQVADCKRNFKAAGKLVSIGQIHHRFTYYFDDPIAIVRQEVAASVIPPGGIFLFTPGAANPTPPFEFDTLEVVSCDRNVKRNGPLDFVLIGRRRPQLTQSSTSQLR